MCAVSIQSNHSRRLLATLPSSFSLSKFGFPERLTSIIFHHADCLSALVKLHLVLFPNYALRKVSTLVKDRQVKRGAVYRKGFDVKCGPLAPTPP